MQIPAWNKIEFERQRPIYSLLLTSHEASSWWIWEFISWSSLYWCTTNSNFLRVSINQNRHNHTTYGLWLLIITVKSGNLPIKRLVLGIDNLVRKIVLTRINNFTLIKEHALAKSISQNITHARLTWDCIFILENKNHRLGISRIRRYELNKGVCCISCNPSTISDQNMGFCSPYFEPQDQNKFIIPFQRRALELLLKGPF